VVCQVQTPRRFEGQPWRDDTRQPSWQAGGKRSGGIKVRVVTYRRQSDVTHRLSRLAQALRATDKRRHAIEAVCRCVHEHLSLAAGQAGDTRLGPEKSPVNEGGPAHQMALGLIASLRWERERLHQGVTRRSLRCTRIVRGLKGSWPSLKRVNMAASLQSLIRLLCQHFT
jgi:hypothetical protein